jgi:hypothetical protein
LKWVPQQAIEQIHDPESFINAIPENGDIGDFFEVDLEILEKDHDL